MSEWIVPSLHNISGRQLESKLCGRKEFSLPAEVNLHLIVTNKATDSKLKEVPVKSMPLNVLGIFTTIATVEQFVPVHYFNWHE